MSLVDIDALPDISIVATDIQTIIDRLINGYETISGSTLPDAAVSRLLLTCSAYAEQLQRTDLNEAVKQTLVAFAIGDQMDQIAALQELSRLTATFAVCTIRFTFATALISDYTIQAGIQVQSSSGLYIFETDEALELSAGDTFGDVTATCTTSGAGANDIPVGEVNNLLDDLAVEPDSVANTDITSGGGGTETDDQLRERFRASNAIKSTAGAIDTYRYYALTASTDIVDVSVFSPTPGTVNICALLSDGGIPGAALLSSIETICSAEDVRPLTDTVTAIAPTIVNVDVDVTFDYLSGYSELTGTIKEQFEKDLTEWANLARAVLGKDIVPDEIIKIGMNIAGVYQVRITWPSYQVISQSEFMNVKSTSVSIGNEYDG
jgi:phage-related baseplate assembly protein